jgi:tryptophan 6-halogenase
MKPTIPRSILIVGGGTAGWVAASLLQAAWAQLGVVISLVESPDVSTIGVGEGSTPLLRRFFAGLGVSEREWMPACNATYKSGIRFAGWSVLPGYEEYFHPFFSSLDSQAIPDFISACDRRRSGEDIFVHPDEYFLATQIAHQKLSPRTQLPEQQQQIEYGYHFDAGLLGAFLRNRAVKSGLHYISDHVTHIKQMADGAIDAVCTQTQGELKADLYVDCTGFSQLLISKTLGEAMISYKENLFNNAAMAVQTIVNPADAIPSETRSETLSTGWAWKIPLMNRVGNGYVYSADFISCDAAELEFRKYLGILDKDIAIKHLPMLVGRIQNHWKKNCLAVGLSQGFIEPLEATALMTTQATVQNFINCIHHVSHITDAVMDRFNFHVNNMMEGIRDYIVCHYYLNSRDDTAYWRACRQETRLSDELKRIINAWDSGESVIDELAKQVGRQNYYAPSWYCLLAGYGRNRNFGGQGLRPQKSRRQMIDQYPLVFSDHRMQLQQLYQQD